MENISPVQSAINYRKVLSKQFKMIYSTQKIKNYAIEKIINTAIS